MLRLHGKAAKNTSSKFFSVFTAALFLFMSVAEANLASQHEVNCAEHLETQEISANSEIHTSECKDLPRSHEHESNPCTDFCHLGHCHASHGNVWAKNGVIYPHLFSGSENDQFALMQWIYRNPYLGNPLQPPRS